MPRRRLESRASSRSSDVGMPVREDGKAAIFITHYLLYFGVNVSPMLDDLPQWLPSLSPSVISNLSCPSSRIACSFTSDVGTKRKYRNGRRTDRHATECPTTDPNAFCLLIGTQRRFVTRS